MIIEQGWADWGMCSLHWTEFKGVQYALCPLQDLCDGSRDEQAETNIPSTDGKLKYFYIKSGFRTADVCRYHFQFPNSATWGDKMRVSSPISEQLTAFVAYGTKFEPKLITEHEMKGTFEIEVKYPYMVWVAVIHKKDTVREAKLQIQYKYLKNANPYENQ
jgi:hypothetical protein